MKNCKKCGKELKERQRKYCSSECRNREEWKRKAKKLRTFAEQVRLKYKLNNCCSECGWSEHSEILQFHHPIKEEKSNRILNHILTKKRLREELNKCVLLCPNCHFWLHHNEMKDNPKQFFEKRIKVPLIIQ